VRKSIDSNQLFPLNVPCTHDCDITDPECQYKCAMQSSIKKHEKKERTMVSLPPATLLPKKKKENFQVVYSDTESPKTTKLSGQDYKELLPIMDPKFNLREICKQCILLEDHLSHNEKRCFDCCVKHFLTIEALAEEAITLDSSNSHSSQQNIKQLPSRVRTLQSKWHENPDENAHIVSQELRKIRKDFQIDAFDVVFRPGSCQDGMCKVK